MIKLGPKISRSVKLLVGLSYFMASLTLVPLLPKFFGDNSQGILWTTLPGVLVGGACRFVMAIFSAFSTFAVRISASK
jgi:VIT1/CCC1 family predicted Fe2+/Mn2+ transporter